MFFLFGENLSVLGHIFEENGPEVAVFYLYCTCGLELYVFQLGMIFLKHWG